MSALKLLRLICGTHDKIGRRPFAALTQ